MRAALHWVGRVMGAALLSAAGCGAAAGGGPAPAPAGEMAGGGWIGAPPDRPAAAPVRTLAAEGPRTIGAPAPRPEPSRPPRRGRLNVSLSDADLPNALRLLAEAGGFSLVVESDVAGSVSTELEGVDPYDALVTIAGANGADVRYEGGVVIVRRRDGR
jgi:hypothetical protein